MGRRLTLGNGLEINFDERGNGDVVILVPGLTCTTRFFVNNIDVIAEKYRVISYDPRSQGGSSKTETGNNFTQRAKDLDEFVNALELNEFILAGWSLGSYDCYAYFQEFGIEKVKAFINIDMPPKIIPTNKGDWAHPSLEVVRGMYQSILAEEQPYFFESYAHYMLTREATPDEINWIVEESKKTPLHTAAQIVADANLCDFSQVAMELAQKKPVMHYIKQDWSDMALDWLKINTPSVKTKVMGGHMMFYEEPEEFNRSLLAFLDTV